MAVRVGFIGTGWAERAQIRAFAEAGLVPSAVVSRHRKNADRVGRAFDIPHVFDSWRDLVASNTVDLVSVTTPPGPHAEISIGALEAGKHVLCEAPAANVDDARAMAAAAVRHPDCLALIDFELRFSPARRELKRRLDAGEAGRLLWIEAEYRVPDALDPAEPWRWENDRDLGGGMLNVVADHLVDQVLWLASTDADVAGALTTVAHARRTTPQGEERGVTSEDHAHLLLRLPDGLGASVVASAISAGEPGGSLVVRGTEGTFRVDADERLWTYGDDGCRRVDSGPRAGEGNGFLVGTRYLARALADSVPLSRVPEGAATFDDGVRVQRLLERAAKVLR